ncbi:MAG: LCP family protein [Muribaculaceae bacterium]|nr:LCP family protein [Alistipes senegalensis]MCM1473093.1 LCP family protein [Muribaculaceae bacterium]
MGKDFNGNEPIRKISQVEGKKNRKNRKNKKNQKKVNSTGGKYEVRPLESEEREKFEQEVLQEHYKGKYDEKALSEINRVQFNPDPPRNYKGKYEKGVVAKDVYNGKYSYDGKKPESHAIVGNFVETYNGRYSADNPESESESDKHIRGIKKLPETPPKKKKKKKPNNNNKKSVRTEQVQKKREKKKNKKKRKSRFSVNDFFVNLVSISASIAVIGVMILNMPILKSNGGNTSIINFVKDFQPLVQVEGELHRNTMDLQINNEIVDVDFSDGLDLPQLVEGQYSVLFLGFDEEEFNTDVIWVCQFDIGHARLNILQIPRDTCFPDYTDSPTGKFNSIYAMGERYVNPPIQRVVNAVQENFGIPIDAYITTGCHDIVDMVDLVGGIPITLDEEIMYEADKRIPAGDTVLSGEQAEWFVRFRWALAEGDIGRMKNQRRFMAAAMEKLFSIVNDEGRLQLYSYLKEIYDNEYIYTNMSLGDIGMLADFAATLSMENVQVNMVPGEGAKYYASDGEVYDIYSVHKLATLNMLNNYFRPYQKIMTSSDSSIVEYITDYQNPMYDDTSDNLQDISDGDADNSSLIFK